MFLYFLDFVLADQSMQCFDNVLCFTISTKHHMQFRVCWDAEQPLCMYVCISGGSDLRESAMNDVCLEVSR